jgi:hypothetical protein
MSFDNPKVQQAYEEFEESIKRNNIKIMDYVRSRGE